VMSEQTKEAEGRQASGASGRARIASQPAGEEASSREMQTLAGLEN
jgi:hypothetical protein